MSQDLILIGSFRVKPDSQAAFDKLVEDLDPEEEDSLVLGDDNLVTLSIYENTSVHSYSEAYETLAQFVDEHSVLGAATLQTGDSPADYTTFSGHSGELVEAARRTAERDYCQKQINCWTTKLVEVTNPPLKED